MPKKITFTAEQVAQMSQLAESGTSTRDLAAMFGAGRSRIAAELKNAGIKLNAGLAISLKMRDKPGCRLGAKHSPETRALMSAQRKGKPGTRFGPISEETRARISASTKGKNTKYTPEQRAELEAMRSRSKRMVRRTLLATGRRKLIPSEVYLGYSKHQLMAHLGPKPSQTAEIDHYVPVVEFFRRGITAPALVNALSNLRWLEGAENKKKGDSVPDDAERVVEDCFFEVSRRSLYER